MGMFPALRFLPFLHKECNLNIPTIDIKLVVKLQTLPINQLTAQSTANMSQNSLKSHDNLRVTRHQRGAERDDRQDGRVEPGGQVG